MLARKPMMIDQAGVTIVYDSFNPAMLTSDGTLSSGNLLLAKTSSAHTYWYAGCAGTLPLTGKTYWEMQYQPGGVVNGKQDYNQAGVSNGAAGLGEDGVFWYTGDEGYGLYGAPNTIQHLADTGYGVTVSPGDWIGFAVNIDTKKIWLRNAAGWNGDPVAGTGGLVMTDMVSPSYVSANCHIIGNDMLYNPGATAFQFPVPATYKNGNYIIL